MGHFYKGCFVVVICTVALASAGPSKCYTCLDGDCDDPFIGSDDKIQNCTGSTSFNNFLRSRGFNEWAEEEDKLLMKFDFRSTNVDNFVCSTFGYEYVNRNIAFRGCVPKEVSSTSFCENLNITVSLIRGKDFSCSLCDTDLCNSGISWKSSLITIHVLFVIFLKLA